ncbi:MAG: hypothetical protein PHQ63_08920, partial [Smithellaceae bacterium]|nr:hypothetical protein [Smithellaceae bacterium]
ILKEEKMKRFWLVLLSLGLIVAFSTSAMALDVKFSGEYYAAGMYMDKTGLNKNAYNVPARPLPGTYARAAFVQQDANPSTAFYFQRLRLGAQFVVSPGLSLIARADVMERAWGAARSAPAGGAGSIDGVQTGPTNVLGLTPIVNNSSGTRAENENIAFDLLYLNYASPIGLFNVGYQIDGAWGTVFGDNSIPTPKIGYILPIGNFAIIAQMGKNPDGERSARMVGGVADAADRDDNFYTLAGRYAWKAGEAGLLFKSIRVAGYRNFYDGIAAPFNVAGTGFTQEVYVVIPYVKAKFGAVAVQAEFTYGFGKKKFEGRPDLVSPFIGGATDADIKSYNGWLDVVGDFGMFYVGLTGAHVSGEDQGTADVIEGQLTGGMDWNPCLIMFNSDRQYWAGSLVGYGTNALNDQNVYNYGVMTNAWFGQIRAGVRPTDKLDIMMSYSYAKADKSLGVGFDNREYGSEIDLTATYKITNNLSYMLGGGYWMVGKYYQGNTTTNNDLQDQLLILNKLTLTF